MKYKFVYLIIFIFLNNSLKAAWWPIDTMIWQKSLPIHTLRIVSQIPTMGVQINKIHQVHSQSNDSLYVNVKFNDCWGGQSYYTWDSTIELEQMPNMQNYNLVLLIGYDTNTINVNCQKYNSPILDTFYLGNVITNIPSHYSKSPLSIYPNPAQNILQIKDEGREIQTISIYNTMGMLVRKENYKPTIDINSLPKGLYHFVAQTSKGSVSETFIKE